MTMGMCFTTLPPPPITYEAVDLGLSSGTKWAAQNVGARKPSDAGLYFQWGDTKGYTKEQVGKGDGKKNFYWPDYKWNPSGDGKTFTKYATTGATLELEDDAAHVNMGGDWHMPTPEQVKELINNTTTAWTVSNGVGGVTLTSKKDETKYIFIPITGYAENEKIKDNIDRINIWSSMVAKSSAEYGQIISGWKDGTFSLDYYQRYRGFSVRGVLG